MRIEILYFEGCPGYAELAPHVRTLIADAGVEADVHVVEVGDPGSALRQRFLGSPTLRVDGVDVEPAAEQRDDYGMKCRLYATAEGLRRLPSDDLILEALRAGR